MQTVNKATEHGDRNRRYAKRSENGWPNDSRRPGIARPSSEHSFTKSSLKIFWPSNGSGGSRLSGCHCRRVTGGRILGLERQARCRPSPHKLNSGALLWLWLQQPSCCGLLLRLRHSASAGVASGIAGRTATAECHFLRHRGIQRPCRSGLTQKTFEIS